VFEEAKLEIPVSMATISETPDTMLRKPVRLELRMKRVTVSAVLLLAVVAFLTARVSAGDLRAGTWKVNIQKSKYSPGPPPTGPNIQKIEAVENGIKMVADGVNAKGQKTHNEYTVRYDGKDYPAHPMLDGKPDPNAVDPTISTKRIDDYTYESTPKNKGVALVTIREVISKDGKTRTVTITGKNAQGQEVNNVVYEKQ
jgi:hypothetical protein